MPVNDDLDNEENPDFDIVRKNKNESAGIDLKQSCSSSDEMRPLLESMNEQQQEMFCRVREWCFRRLRNPDVEPIRLFITGGTGTGKSHLLKCL
jgi:DNA replication protein DnaC